MISTLLAQIKNPVAPNLSPNNESQGLRLFGSLIQQIIGLLFVFAFIAFFFMFVLGAIKWIMSGGDKAGVEGARNQITHALIGLVILISIFAIIKLIETVIGVCILEINLGLLRIESTGISSGGITCGTSSDYPTPNIEAGPNMPGFTR